MILEGDESVFAAMKEKKRLRDAGQPHDHIRPMLFIDGGLMKGAYGVGAGLALEEAGYSDLFTSVVGVSSGAPTAAYFIAGQMQATHELLYKECCSKRFINMWRFWNQVDTQFFVDVLQGRTGRGIDSAGVLESPSDLYVGVSNYATGAPMLLEPRTPDELFNALHASILMPNVSRHRVMFEAIRYVDGGFTKPHVLGKAIEEVAATHYLIITNQDQTVTTVPLLERIFNHTIFRWRMTGKLRQAAHGRRRERQRALEQLKNGNYKPYAVIWGDHSILGLERNPEKVRRVVEASRRWWQELIA